MNENEYLAEDEYDRLDTFLTGELGITRTRVQGLIKNKHVTKVGDDTGNLKPSMKVQAGDKFIVNMPVSDNVAYLRAEPVDFDVVYEDKYIIVVNKPAGVVVHPSPDGMEVSRERNYGTNPAGSLVVFGDPFTGQYLANRRVLGEGRDAEGRPTTRLDRPVPASFDGKAMFAPRFRGIGTIVSGCSWKNGRWTGVVIQTPDAIVENCRMRNVWQEGVRASFLGDFSEGPSPYNVLVRNCTIEKCNCGVVGHYRHSADGRKTWASATAAPIRAVEVEGCAFRDISGTALKFNHSGDCRFRDNTFENVAETRSLAVCEDMDFDN